jgi:hypothetical protein
MATHPALGMTGSAVNTLPTGGAHTRDAGTKDADTEGSYRQQPCRSRPGHHPMSSPGALGAAPNPIRGRDRIGQLLGRLMQQLGQGVHHNPSVR